MIAAYFLIHTQPFQLATPESWLQSWKWLAVPWSCGVYRTQDQDSMLVFIYLIKPKETSDYIAVKESFIKDFVFQIVYTAFVSMIGVTEKQNKAKIKLGKRHINCKKR